MRKYEIIHTVVFPLGKNGGNPCPVVIESHGLSTCDMQDIAKQQGHETCFVNKTNRSDCDYEFRYFVPNHEMEMCIHATIGAVTVLVEKGLVENSPLAIETLLGTIQVDWEREEGSEEIRVEVHQFLPQVKESLPALEAVCRALKISPTDLSTQPIQSISTSRHKLMIPMDSVQKLNSLTPDVNEVWNLCDQYGITGFYPFAVEDFRERIVQARQFPNRAGYDEDPATGVAASALGAYLHSHGLFNDQEDGWHTYKVKQGVAMGRPSYIETNVRINEGKINGTSITGYAEIL